MALSSKTDVSRYLLGSDTAVGGAVAQVGRRKVRDVGRSLVLREFRALGRIELGIERLPGCPISREDDDVVPELEPAR